MCFWLLDDYPSSAPMAFVKPTLDMQIRASDEVDLNGRITIPYILHWTCPDSNLLELVRVCGVVFGDAPPVFTKPRSQRTKNQLPRQTSLQIEHRQGNGQVRRSYSAQEQDTREDEEEAIDEEHVKASIVSAVEQKVKGRLQEEFSRTRAEIDVLHSTNRELLDSQEKISVMIKDMEGAEEDAKDRMEQLKRAEQELEQAMLRLSVKVSVDDLVVVSSGGAADIQQVEAVADDLAVDDAIFALGRALQEHRVECDVYLKKVRELSRLQFKKRAIIVACEQRRKEERREKVLNLA